MLEKYIDHTLLKPDATRDDIIKLCDEAKKYGFYSVCVNPYYVPLAKEELKDSDVKITTVIGFPLGANMTEVKVYEAKKAIEAGADEIDMVINIAALKNKEYSIIENEIVSILNEIKGKAKLKVIIETCLLTEEEKIKMCEIALKTGVDFIKTSTGFSSGGATYEDVKLIKKVVGDKIGIKASGGIRTKEKAIKMIEEGATRLGTSSSLSIIDV